MDVSVFGAGAFGLSVAYVCALRGAKVRVIDPNGVGGGASGGIVGALAPHVPETWNPKKQFQFEALDMAEVFWRGIEERGGQSSSFARTGRLQPIADEQALTLALDRAQSALTVWQGRYAWEVIEASGGWAPPTPTGLLIHDTLTGRLFPRHACAALASAIMELGGEIVLDGPATGRVVHATGAAGLAELSDVFGTAVGSAVKGQAARLAHDARALPQIFADSVHIVPHADGTVAIGSTSERAYEEPACTDDQLDVLIARARAVVPALADAPVIERWAGLRPRARTRAPMLGPWPGRPGQFIANGGFKIGFGIAPKVGEVMADLVLEGRDAIPEAFRVEASL